MTAWTGKDLADELSALLGDTSSTFKTRVVGWINDTQDDILARHDWRFQVKKAKKLLTADSEEQDIFPAAPGAPSVALSAGGSLDDASVYEVAITFIESVSGYETTVGTASASLTAGSGNNTIAVTAIPVGAETLTTGRRVYLRKDSGNWLLVETISDNTTTTATIAADTTDLNEPPEESMIRKLDGNPYFETSSQLENMPIDQMRLLFQGAFGSGTPTYWHDLGETRLLLYPKPSSALELSFYYFIRPRRVVYQSDSTLLLPSWAKKALKAGVIASGYEYRDRDGQEGKALNYENLLARVVSQAGSSIKGAQRVRSVVGDSDGWVL